MSGRDPWAYGRPLSFPMKLALRAIADRDSQRFVEGDWMMLTGWVDCRSLPALERRGLIKYAQAMGSVRLTDAGRSAAAELKGDGA